MLSDSQMEMIRDILSVRSVGGDAEEGAPYGRKPREVLDRFLEYARRDGMRTGVLDDKVGYCEIGSGEELFGIVCHLDVVPEGDGWDTDPFEAVIKDGSIYARGIVDDKGPALASYFAMKEILDAKVPLSKRVRLILGTDEERTCSCIENYDKNGEIPYFAITPDAEFPVIYAEKGILQIKLTGSGRDYTVTGGSAANMVPAKACYTKEDEELMLTGRTAHASRPELGKNAVLKLAQMICAIHPDYDGLLALLSKYDGSGLTGNVPSDHSGELTTNPAVIYIGPDRSELTIDIRYPVTASCDYVIDAVRKSASAFGLSVEVVNHMPPVVKDKDSDEIRMLSSIWQEHMQNFTGYEEKYRELYSEPLAIGGGTYARHMRNTVAFGMQAPWQEDQCHQSNEHMAVSDFAECINVIKDTILRQNALS